MHFVRGEYESSREIGFGCERKRRQEGLAVHQRVSIGDLVGKVRTRDLEADPVFGGMLGSHLVAFEAWNDDAVDQSHQLEAPLVEVPVDSPEFDDLRVGIHVCEVALEGNVTCSHQQSRALSFECAATLVVLHGVVAEETQVGSVASASLPCSERVEQSIGSVLRKPVERRSGDVLEWSLRA